MPANRLEEMLGARFRRIVWYVESNVPLLVERKPLKLLSDSVCVDAQRWVTIVSSPANWKTYDVMAGFEHEGAYSIGFITRGGV